MAKDNSWTVCPNGHHYRTGTIHNCDDVTRRGPGGNKPKPSDKGQPKKDKK